MTESKFNDLHRPYFPNPWDDPEDRIDALFWLDAIANDELGLIAEYLQRSETAADRKILSALADKLDPRTSNATRYVWKAHHGRPRRRLNAVSDSLQAALDDGGLGVVASHLRTTSKLDPRVISWVADQMDPDQGRSHFRVKHPRGPRSRSGTTGLPFANDIPKMLLGAKIARLHQTYGKLEAALADCEEAGSGMSRSTARRAYDYYRKRTGRGK
jgi:hypothetical protein